MIQREFIGVLHVLEIFASPKMSKSTQIKPCANKKVIYLFNPFRMFINETDKTPAAAAIRDRLYDDRWRQEDTRHTAVGLDFDHKWCC